MEATPHIAILILAAGQSTRMKEHIKQLLPLQKNTLLGKAIEEATASNAKKVFVVVGAFKEEITENIGLNPDDIIYNPNWEQGMGSSIASGINHIRSSSTNIGGVLVMLADQPLIDATYLNQLIREWLKDSSKIVTTKYAKRSGVPALFGAPYFDNLSQLDKDFGAKHLIEQHSNFIMTVDAKGKELDLDDYQTYQNFIKTN